MSRKTKMVLAILLAAVLLAVLCFGGWYWSTHVFLDGQVYPKDAARLDLRGQEITPEHWKVLSAQLPECEILWDVPFQGGRVYSDVTELAVTSLSEEDLAVLKVFSQLKQLDANGCTDYEMLTAFQASRPEVEVSYTVTLDGQDYSWNAEALTLNGFTDEDYSRLAWLPNVKTVDASGISELTVISKLQQALPDCDITYQVAIGEEIFPHTVQSLSLTGTDPAELAEKLPYLPQVTAVDIRNPGPSGEVLLALPEQFPEVNFTWETDLYGVLVNAETTEVNLTDIPLENTQAVRKVLACYPNVEKLILSGCGLDNETLAAFREEVRPEYKVVWSVQIGPITIPTDSTYLIPIKYDLPYMNDADVANLRYCEDMVCIDLGHHRITHCDWAAYMPKMKYLILADSALNDISGLEGLTELVFLELFMTPIKDLTPLESLTALEDLNLSYTWLADPTPVSRMPWLKRLWWAECPWSEKTFSQYLPDTEFSFARRSSTGGTWRQGQNYYDMRDFIGMHYMVG